MLRQTMTDESDARHSNETGVKKKHENTRKEAYTQSRTRSVWLNRTMTRYLIANYAAYATAAADFVVSSSFDYVTLTYSRLGPANATRRHGTACRERTVVRGEFHDSHEKKEKKKE